MIANWPLSLPKALRVGHGYKDFDGRVVTNMQQGPPRLRRLYKNTPRTYPLQLRLSQTQLKTFEDFYTHTLAGGVKPAYVPVLDENGFRSVSVFVLNKGEPKNAGGNYFNLTIQVVTT